MEYLRGGELLHAICRRDFYSENDARKVMHQITSALEYMHSRRVIHRDIKPMNLILASRSVDSQVKIVDFGFATIETEQLKQPSRFLCGTPGYMAPEVILDRSYSSKVDIWGLGVVLYILLSGTMPFSPDPAGEICVLNGEYSFPDQRFAHVSSQAKDLIKKLLVVNPEKRLNASEVLEHSWMRQHVYLSSISNGLLNSHSKQSTPRLQTPRPSNTPRAPYTPVTPGTNNGIRYHLSSQTQSPDNVSSDQVLPDNDISSNLDALRAYHATWRSNNNNLAHRLWQGVVKSFSIGSSMSISVTRNPSNANSLKLSMPSNINDNREESSDMDVEHSPIESPDPSMPGYFFNKQMDENMIILEGTHEDSTASMQELLMHSLQVAQQAAVNDVKSSPKLHAIGEHCEVSVVMGENLSDPEQNHVEIRNHRLEI